MTGASLKQNMRHTLDNLGKQEFIRFKRYLKDKDKIAWGELEKADRNKTVDLMVQVYTEDAGNLMVMISREMNQNQSAMELETNLQKICKCVLDYNALQGNIFLPLSQLSLLILCLCSIFHKCMADRF